MAGKHGNPPAVHPGTYIRESILPTGLSVKKAAEMLGVSRPALSNLLNRKASLSPEMALRFEKARDDKNFNSAALMTHKPEQRFW